MSDIIKKINEVKLYQCNNVCCGDVLYYALQNHSSFGLRDLFIAIKVFIRVLFFDSIDIVKNGTGSTVFLFSNSYRSRVDHYKSFLSIVSLSKNNITVVPGKRKFKFHRGFISLFNKWNKQLSFLGVYERMFISACLMDVYSNYTFVEEYIKENNLDINQLVTFCDVHAIDSFITQMYNEKNIKTITLQHGVFTSRGGTWALTASHSRYFIAMNQFTVDEATLVGYKNTMIVAGMFASVNKEPTKRNIERINSIGIFLDTEIYRADNIKTLKTVEEYSKKYPKKFLIKFHPTSNIDSYRIFTDAIENCNCIGKEMNIFEFCNNVDLVIARNSSTLIESLQYCIPAYIIHDDDQIDDLYGNVNKLKFNNVDELHYLIDVQSINVILDQMKDARNYFCAEGNVTDNYKNVFSSLGID